MLGYVIYADVSSLTPETALKIVNKYVFSLVNWTIISQPASLKRAYVVFINRL